MEFPLEWGETETDGDHQWWCTNTYKLVPPSSMEVTQHPFPRGAHGFLCRPAMFSPPGVRMSARATGTAPFWGVHVD